MLRWEPRTTPPTASSDSLPFCVSDAFSDWQSCRARRWLTLAVSEFLSTREFFWLLAELYRLTPEEGEIVSESDTCTGSFLCRPAFWGWLSTQLLLRCSWCLMASMQHTEGRLLLVNSSQLVRTTRSVNVEVPQVPGAVRRGQGQPAGEQCLCFLYLVIPSKALQQSLWAWNVFYQTAWTYFLDPS